MRFTRTLSYPPIGLSRAGRRRRSLIIIFVFVLSLLTQVPRATFALVPGDLYGPTGSGLFGSSVTVLQNGNLVVTDPGYDMGSTQDVGAVYLYHGGTHALISTLTGSSAGDQVGFSGVVALSNGNYAVSSSYWNGGMGAVTWGNGASGVSGSISSQNSLVGSNAKDYVGNYSVVALSNGNYLVRSPNWNENRGAATWGNGSSGVSGSISGQNSLVGSGINERVGGSVVALTNGNYVVLSPNWNGRRGAATWGNGSGGTSGSVSAQNSLVGSVNDNAGGSVVALSNGNYVVLSMGWNEGRGAATWSNGTIGSVGLVTANPSIVGETATSGGTFTSPQQNNLYGQIVVGIPVENRVAFLQSLSITSAALAAGWVGQPYSHSFSVSGSPAPSFSLAPGSSLPAGLSLVANGTLSGTPSVAGTFNFTLVASNGAQPDAAQTFIVRIAQPTLQSYIPLYLGR